MARPQDYLKDELDAHLCVQGSLVDWIEVNALDGMWYWNLERTENRWFSDKFLHLLGYEATTDHTWWQRSIFDDDLTLLMHNCRKHCEHANYPMDQIVRFRHRLGRLDGSAVAATVFATIPARQLGCLARLPM